jgi:hypothetical protein
MYLAIRSAASAAHRRPGGLQADVQDVIGENCVVGRTEPFPQQIEQASIHGSDGVGLVRGQVLANQTLPSQPPPAYLFFTLICDEPKKSRRAPAKCSRREEICLTGVAALSEVHVFQVFPQGRERSTLVGVGDFEQQLGGFLESHGVPPESPCIGLFGKVYKASGVPSCVLIAKMMK